MSRNFLATLPCLVCLASDAQRGTMQLRVRDSHTHFPVHAVIQGWGPKSFSVATDNRGYGKFPFPPGEYQLQISALDYAPLTTHYSVERGKITKAGAFIDPLSLPHEESSEVLASFEHPGYTLLHEYVLDEQTGRPLSGVRVRFVVKDLAIGPDEMGGTGVEMERGHGLIEIDATHKLMRK